MRFCFCMAKQSLLLHYLHGNVAFCHAATVFAVQLDLQGCFGHIFTVKNTKNFFFVSGNLLNTTKF